MWVCFIRKLLKGMNLRSIFLDLVSQSRTVFFKQMHVSVQASRIQKRGFINFYSNFSFSSRQKAQRSRRNTPHVFTAGKNELSMWISHLKDTALHRVLWLKPKFRPSQSVPQLFSLAKLRSTWFRFKTSVIRNLRMTLHFIFMSVSCKGNAVSDWKQKFKIAGLDAELHITHPQLADSKKNKWKSERFCQLLIFYCYSYNIW